MPVHSRSLRQYPKSAVFAIWLWTLTVQTVFTVPGVQAARPLITDDARLVDPQACQVETWTQLSSGGNEYWALPACNFTGNLEVTAGTGFLPGEAGGSIENEVLQLASARTRAIG